jgi:hypothetical protein
MLVSTKSPPRLRIITGYVESVAKVMATTSKPKPRHMSTPMLNWHAINNQHQFDIKKFTFGYQNCNISQIFIFDGYIKVRKSLHNRVIMWVDTSLKHIATSTTLPRYEGPCMVHIRE